MWFLIFDTKNFSEYFHKLGCTIDIHHRFIKFLLVSYFFLPCFDISFVLFTNYHVKEKVEHVEYFSSNGGWLFNNKVNIVQSCIWKKYSLRESFQSTIGTGFYFLLFPLDTLESFTLKCILIILIGQSIKPWTPCV